MRTRWLPLTALLLLASAPLAAQEREIRDANLPYELETRLIRLYDRSSTRHFQGNAYVSPREIINADVGALGGTLRLAGRVHGDLAMVGGDVVLERTAVVTGDVIVVGGEVRMEDGADVDGSVTSYGATDRRSDRGRDRDRDRGRDRWSLWDRGYSRLTLRAGYNYNRVEGLPIMFGPVIQTGGGMPLKLEALAIWRSETGTELEPDRFGYLVRAEQFIGRRDFSVGGSVYSVVQAMDPWQVSDLEASLGAAVFREDFRDYYDRTGWSAFVRANPVDAFDIRFEYRREDHLAVPAENPWSLLDRGQAWRLQPLAAEGRVETVAGDLTLDFRDDERDPYTGWYINAVVEKAINGELTRPGLTLEPGQDALFPGGAPVSMADRTYDMDFTDGFIDVRRYNPVGYRSQLNLRAVVGGSLTDAPLPPQYQHALGGFGTLPGYDLFEADCGSHLATGVRTVDGVSRLFNPSYGCDRFALFQAEYRGSLSLDFGFGDQDWDEFSDWWIDADPNWVVFFDAGRGWSNDATDLAGLSTGTDWLYDAGVGFLIDEVGFYVALPLTEDGGAAKFFFRLQRRF